MNTATAPVRSRVGVIDELEKHFLENLAENPGEGSDFDQVVLESFKRLKEEAADRIVLAMITRSEKSRGAVVVLGVSLSQANMDFPTALKLRDESDQRTIVRAFGKGIWNRCASSRKGMIEVQVPANKKMPSYRAKVYAFDAPITPDGHVRSMQDVFGKGSEIRKQQPYAAANLLWYDATFGKNASDDWLDSPCYEISYARGVELIARTLFEKGLIA